MSIKYNNQNDIRWFFKLFMLTLYRNSYDRTIFWIAECH